MPALVHRCDAFLRHVVRALLCAVLGCLAPLNMALAAESGGLAAPVLSLGSKGALALGPYLRTLEDPQGRLSLADVRRAASGTGPGQWQPRNPRQTAAPHFGLTNSSFWLQAPLHRSAQSTGDWLLGVRYPLLDYLDIYLVYPDGRVVHRASGDRRPFNTRDLPDRHLYFHLDLPPGGQVEMFVRVQGQGSLQVPIELSSTAAQATRRADEQGFQGVYLGALMAMMLYNLMLALSLRDGSHLLYVAYTAVFGISQLALNGLAFEYLWPTTPNWGNQATPFFLGLAGASLSVFSRRFLDLARHSRAADWLIAANQWLFLAVAFSSLVVPYAWAVRVGTLAATLTPALLFGITLWLLLKGARQARYFMLAFAGLLLGSSVNAASMFDWITPNWVTEHAVQLGALLEFILLSFALAHRIKLAREDNERLQQAHAQELESRVRNRTRELDQALDQLTQANQRLHALSEEDRLTGLKNRTFLSESLPEIWRMAQRTQQPLSVLMIDIDHFKQVNDQHGHLAGDEALRMVATVLARTVQRPGDHVVRYGGEEFLVVLPNTPTAGAAHIAETLRRQIEELDFRVGEERVPLTASLGLASVVPSASVTAQALLKTADQLLYLAKQTGRNRCAMLPQALGTLQPPRKATAPLAQA